VALSLVPAPGVAANTVLEVVQKGYELNERLLRAAKVLVARGEGP
jgi:molecular chaperone GrpE